MSIVCIEKGCVLIVVSIPTLTETPEPLVLVVALFTLTPPEYSAKVLYSLMLNCAVLAAPKVIDCLL